MNTVIYAEHKFRPPRPLSDENIAELHSNAALMNTRINTLLAILARREEMKAHV